MTLFCHKCQHNLENVLIKGNSSSNGNGGGIYYDDVYPRVVNVSLIGNTAKNGGGMFNDGSRVGLYPYIYNVTFYGNSAINGYGGAIYNFKSGPWAYYITISGNTALFGAGIYNSVQSHPTVDDGIIWGNKRFDGTLDQVYNFDTSSDLKATYTDIQGGCTLVTGLSCSNVIDENPSFGEVGNYGGNTFTLPLQPDSQVIDRIPFGAVWCGNNSSYSIDQRGVARPNGNGCDMGAYEFQHDFLFIPIIMK